MSSFQSSAGAQGRQFAEQCDLLLVNLGFTLSGTMRLSEIGVEIDREARGPAGASVWFEYKGSVQGRRPGLIRTDTLKKAIANGALLAAIPEHPPYVLLTSHLPERGAALAMLRVATELGYFDDVVCIYQPGELERLRRW